MTASARLRCAAPLLVPALLAAGSRGAHAQAVPLNVSAMASVKSVSRPRASLDGPALDSALVHLEFTKWALGNVGRLVETEPLFGDRFLNVGLEPSGVRRLAKSEAFTMIRSMTAMKMPSVPMELGDWKVVRAGADARLVSFALRAMGGRMWVSSLWERQPAGWATVFYQVTPDAPMPAMPAKPSW